MRLLTFAKSNDERLGVEEVQYLVEKDVGPAHDDPAADPAEGALLQDAEHPAPRHHRTDAHLLHVGDVDARRRRPGRRQ